MTVTVIVSMTVIVTAARPAVAGVLRFRRRAGSLEDMDLPLGDMRVIDLTVARAGPTRVRGARRTRPLPAQITELRAQCVT